LNITGLARGLPEVLEIDNGTEFTSHAVDDWAYANDVRLDFNPRETHGQRCTQS
jgi:putative transposase